MYGKHKSSHNPGNTHEMTVGQIAGYGNPKKKPVKKKVAKKKAPKKATAESDQDKTAGIRKRMTDEEKKKLKRKI